MRVSQRDRRTAALRLSRTIYAALAIEVEAAPGWQKREVRFDLLDDGPSPTVDDCAESILKSKLAVLLTDEVDDGQVALAGRAAQTAPELLSEHGRRCRRTEEQDAIDVRHVDTLAEDLHGKHAAELAVP